MEEDKNYQIMIDYEDEKYLLRHGCLNQYISDKAGQIMSKLLQQDKNIEKTKCFSVQIFKNDLDGDLRVKIIEYNPIILQQGLRIIEPDIVKETKYRKANLKERIKILFKGTLDEYQYVKEGEPFLRRRERKNEC